MNNPFDQFDSAPSAAPQAPGVIRGKPKQPTQLQTNADQRSQIATDLAVSKFEAEQGDRVRRNEREATEEAEKAAKQARASESAGYNVQKVLEQIKKVEVDAKDNGGWFETGTSGSFARTVFPEGTAGSDLASALQNIDANNAFTTLQQMRDNSPTGGALGQVTERELDLLKSSVANLNPNQGHEQFLSSLQVAKDYYIDMLERIDPEKAKAYMGERRNATVFAVDGILDKRGKEGVASDAEQIFYDEKGNLIGFLSADGNFMPVGGSPETPNKGGFLQDFGAGVGDIVEGGGDLLGLVANPANAAVNTVFGTDLTTDLGGYLREASGLPDSERPIASAINKGGVGALSFAGAAKAAQPLATGATNALMGQVAQQPIRQGVAGVSAGASTEGANQMGAPVPVQMAAGLLGGMAGFGGASASANAFASKAPNALGQAAKNQRIDLIPADAGGANVRRLTSASSQTPISAAPIRKAAQKSQEQFADASKRASDGTAQFAEDAGEAIARGGEKFVKESGKRGGALYDRAEKMAKGISVKPKASVKAIDDQIAELAAAKETNAPLIQVLEKFKADLSANSGVKVSGMRDLRTAAQKGAYSDDLRATPANRVLGIVADSIGKEIEVGLRSAGRGNAANAFKTADAYWRERVQHIDSVLQPIIGKNKSGEAVLNAVEQMARGKGKGVKTLMGLMRSVDKSELSDIQATIIGRMGRSIDSQQNAEGTAYSASTFLTNWNKMSVRGRSTLFPSSAVRKNLDELAKVADSMKESSSFANHSNTGGAITGNAIVLGGIAYANPLAALVGVGAQYLTGRALASPRLTKWLLNSQKGSSETHIKRLDAIAASEPIIANDIASIKQFLSQAPSTTRAAASEQVGEERPKPE